MPVASYCFDRGQTIPSARRFLDRWLAQAKQYHQSQLVSLSVEVPSVDALAVLDRIVARGDRHLYLEQPAAQTAVVGFGTTLCFETDGPGRFRQARRFIDRWMNHLHSYSQVSGEAGANWARFFCAFTFFPTAGGAAAPPSAMAVLPRWQLVRQPHRGVLTLNHLLTDTDEADAILAALDSQVQAIEGLGFGSGRLGGGGGRSHQPDWGDGQRFQQAVHRALGHMTRHPVQKIVLAHALDWVSPRPFQPVASLHRLRQRHPNCHLFSLSHGDGKSFIGASPERLLSLAQGELVTDALAGSAPRGTTPQEDTTLGELLLRNPKEQGEHRLVVEFLARQLQGAGLRPQYQVSPGLRRLANIQHLHTPIRATVPRHTHPLHIVEALHPTPAVAGVPTREACDQIRRFEDFDRGLYAAPLGWVGANGDSEFIVGIRSALVAGTRARLYAGAGIVAGSDPNREWAELQLKFRALGESLV